VEEGKVLPPPEKRGIETDTLSYLIR